jgi:hypothetical protein
MRQLAMGAEARADQAAVWQEVDQKLDDVAASAPTRAMHDGYEHRRNELREMAAACRFKSGQTGMLVAIGGEFCVLDRVSQPHVLSSLLEPLVQGYALDALGARSAEPPSVDDGRRFLEHLTEQPIAERDGVGIGRDVRLSGADVAGAGVVCADELVQLSVFVRDVARVRATTHRGRIRRPSRRRR